MYLFRFEKIINHKGWKPYIESLRIVLDELEVLLANVDAENVVITADHGEAFGEIGFYAHQIGCPLPEVRKVPWIGTTATDQGEYIPQIDPNTTEYADLLEEHPLDLGYLSS